MWTRSLESHGKTAPAKRMRMQATLADMSIWSINVSVSADVMPKSVSYGSKAKIRFQSFFMLMTIQPCCFASAMSASLNVPIFDAAP